MNQGLYFAESKTVSAFNPGYIDLFFKQDYYRLLDMITSNKINKIFIENKETLYPQAFCFEKDINKVFLNRMTKYKKIDDNGSMALYERHKDL